MIHLVTWLPLPYQLTLCRTLNDAYEGDFVVWFAERGHEDFPYRSLPEESFPSHYLAEEGYWSLLNALRSDPEAVVILGGWSSPMSNRTLLMTALLRIPVFIWADHPHPRQRRWVIDRLRRLYLRFLDGTRHGFLACGRPTLEHLVSLGIRRSRITVFPCWAEVPKQWSLPHGCKNEERPLRLVAVGRLATVKQFEVAIKAVVEANRESDRMITQLVIVGDGPEREHLESLARQLGAELSVSFSGWLEMADVLNELKAADALVLPSKFDAFGVVVVEAMAAGRAVLASDGVVAAIDRDNGSGAVLLHQTGDVQFLSKQIIALANDRGRLKVASLAARAIAEEWLPERAVVILDNLLAETKKGARLLKRRQEPRGRAQLENRELAGPSDSFRVT